MVAPRTSLQDEFDSYIFSSQLKKAIDILRANLSNNIDLDRLNGKGYGPLHIAAASGDMELIVCLITHGATVNYLSSNGNTALHIAAMNGHEGIADVLLKYGANPSITNTDGIVAIEMASTEASRNAILRSMKVQIQITPGPPPSSSFSNIAAALGEMSMNCNSSSNNKENEFHSSSGYGTIESKNESLELTNSTNDELSDDDEAIDIERRVLVAAKETARQYRSLPADCERRQEIFMCCLAGGMITLDQQASRLLRLSEILEINPLLACVRAADNGNYATDGFTPLHCAAKNGSTGAIEILVRCPQVDVWATDLQGRTALHVAAEWEKAECCTLLREIMKTRGKTIVSSTEHIFSPVKSNMLSSPYPKAPVDPVGDNAPTDLTGTTPLGWTARRFCSERKPAAAVENALFSPGDKSILPHTPLSKLSKIVGTRSVGRRKDSPFFSSKKNMMHSGSIQKIAENEENDIVFAFSEAGGWRQAMEDKIMIACPLAGCSSWSLFGVLDGHGGCFSSDFLSKEIPKLISTEALRWLNLRLPSSDHSSHRSSSEPTADDLRFILRTACLHADKSLMEQPRMVMKICENALMGGRKKPQAMDSSGSTMVACLLTPLQIAIANVGDSRAVLGQWQKAIGVDKSNEEEIWQISAVPLTIDHKLNIISERNRAESAGATVERSKSAEDEEEPDEDVLLRVSYPLVSNLKLAMSRSFGDFYLKTNSNLPPELQAVIAVPDVEVIPRTEREAFIVLACDGIWDVMSNQGVIDHFSQAFGYTVGSSFARDAGGLSYNEITTATVSQACDVLLEKCLALGSEDNMSVLVIVISAQADSSSVLGQSEYVRSPPASVSNVRTLSPLPNDENSEFFEVPSTSAVAKRLFL